MKDSSSGSHLLFNPEIVFLILGTIFGLAFVFITPPALVGDEPHHFFRAYQISDGQIIGEKREDFSGGLIPASVFETNRRLVGGIEMNHQVKFETNLFSELLYLPLKAEDKTFVRFPNTVVYAPIPYLPQALGIVIGKIFGASPLALIYLARIPNLLFFLALAYSAVKKTPVHKWLFCLLALTPTSIFQVASASVDAFTFGICFLTVAHFLFYALDETGELTKLDFVKIFALSLLAVLSKQAYIFLPVLFLLIPRRKIGSTLKYAAIFVALLMVCVAAELIWANAVKAIYLPYRNDIPIDPKMQAGFIMNRPFTFARLAIYNYFFHWSYYIKTFFGQLTWLDLYVPNYLIVFWCIVTAVIAALDKNLKIAVSFFNKLIFLMIIIGTALLISALLYMSWSPIGGDEIEGIQGRYFIPVAPLFFLLFYNQKIRWKSFDRYIPLIVTTAVIFSMVVTINAVFQRYYI